MQTQIKTLFPGQQADEKICLEFRQHWIILFSKLFFWSAFVVAYLILDYFSITWIPGNVDPVFLPLIGVFKIVFLMFLLLSLFVIFILYYLNTFIITSERIVDIEQKSLLTHTISELHLEQIQDVTAEVHGLAQNMLDFGDVYIQTAGETQRFRFESVPNPTKITKLILDLYEQSEESNKSHPSLAHPTTPTPPPTPPPPAPAPIPTPTEKTTLK